MKLVKNNIELRVTQISLEEVSTHSLIGLGHSPVETPLDRLLRNDTTRKAILPGNMPIDRIGELVEKAPMLIAAWKYRGYDTPDKLHDAMQKLGARNNQSSLFIKVNFPAFIRGQFTRHSKNPKSTSIVFTELFYLGCRVAGIPPKTALDKMPIKIELPRKSGSKHSIPAPR